MECFRHFTAPLRELFAGNLLLLLCSVFYLIWWVATFRPNASRGAIGVFSITSAFLTGIIAMVLMSVSVSALAPHSKSVPVRFILMGAAVLYLLLLWFTSAVLHRAVTSELLIIHIWAALELSAVAVLYGTGRFDFGRAATLAALVGIATVVGLVCYVLYYRLEGISGYLDGILPLASDALVMAVFLGMLALS